MDASTRLYKRLGEIPEDPNDPESLDDLIVCAFGAFERYYLCWKTKSGEYRQDDYGLPPALKDWLYPSDGTTRDFASLQVVFGRGEEYFASDKNGKLEYKEPEVKKPVPADDDEKFEKQAIRRSRTVSFLRPLSETSVRSDSVMSETSRSKRSSSISSQRASRPPSLSYTNSRTNSEISILGDTIVEGQASQPIRPSYISQWSNLGSRAVDIGQAQSPLGPADETLELSPKHTQEFRQSESRAGTTTTPSQVQNALAANSRPGQPDDQPQPNITAKPSKCTTCGCHASPTPSSSSSSSSAAAAAAAAKPTYTTATTQTSPPPSPPPPLQSRLRIDTSTASASAPSFYLPQQANHTAPPDAYYDDEADYYHYEAPPVVMGRMSSYFNKPGYQLGDSLFSGYQPINWGATPTTYVYQDTFGEEALR